MPKGWLIYYEEDYQKNRAFADQFTARCGEFGLELELKLADDLMPEMPPKGLPDFAVNRSRDALLAHWLESSGCRVFNSAMVCETCNDKARTHLLAHSLGLPQVDMAFLRNNSASLRTHGLGYPVVVKAPGGHGGGEVLLAHSEEELLRVAQALPGGRLVLQRLCGAPGVDVRVYVLGGKVLAAVRREAQDGFRANLSLGGTVRPYALKDTEKQMVLALADALRPDYIGIDFLMDADGSLRFNEAEDAVGSRALYQLGGFDVVGLYLQHIAESLRKR